jgi:hypothetical protein
MTQQAAENWIERKIQYGYTSHDIMGLPDGRLGELHYQAHQMTEEFYQENGEDVDNPYSQIEYDLFVEKVRRSK